ncbi:hypothetical protein ACQEVZ_60620 [Dactylosporangium sp. CA-152071]|uniref:hypothetical protein n=1 Tax=Dactylosporangium sp. CA-152071 TaxID=3239933 RepID=UPI003D93BA43
MRSLEALFAAVVVGLLVLLLVWRLGADLVIAPTGAALLTFLVVLLRSGAGHGPSLRRPVLRRRIR